MFSNKIVHHHFAEVSSTNSWAKENCNSFPTDEITLITAEKQTAGRGRFNRKWLSPPDQNVYASFCFFVKDHRPTINHVGQMLSLTTSKILENLGFDPSLKWPNDLMIHDKKVGGILCETLHSQRRLCVIAGLGLNVNMPKDTLKTIPKPATSLLVEKGSFFDIEMITTQIQRLFVKNLILFLREGFDPFFSSYCDKLAKNDGHVVSLRCGNKIWEGEVDAINSDGSLSLKLSSGELKTFHSGEKS